MKNVHKSQLFGLVIMVVVSLVLICGVNPAYTCLSKTGRVQRDNHFTPGTYTSSAKGFGGEVIAEVVVSDHTIEKLMLTGEGETPELGGAALGSLEKTMLKEQTSDIDSITGATISSDAAKLAVKKALAEASGEEVEEDCQKADIVVIGAGGAGMTAAIQSAMDGADNVVVLEKMPITGGNTIRATGGLNAAKTPYQKEAGIEDSIDLFIEDTMKGGKNKNNPELVKEMAENSADAVKWVNDMGGDLAVVGQFGGASVKRIHRPSDTSAVGPMLVNTLNNKLKELNIPVFLETKAEHILLDEDGAVCGVEAIGKDGAAITIQCKAVVLSTGGFGANNDMIVKYREDLKGFGTTNHSGATGDGIVMAEELDVELVDIDQIQTHPTVNPETTTMFTEGVRGNGAILVNKNGTRFINELETRDVVSEAILNQEGGQSYMIFDQSVRESLSAIEKYIKKGIVVEADTPEELAEAVGVDGTALKETLLQYASYQAEGTDPDFGRKSMDFPLNNPPYYACICAPAVHHTMGGVKINTDTEVIKKDGTKIPGLFAAGEVVGGVHGANRLGGNAVTDIVVFGRVAGSKACDYVKEHGGVTERTMKLSEETKSEAKPEVQGNYKDGTYTGTGKGNNGDITVEVIVEGGNVTTISLTDQHETPGIYETAEQEVTALIIKKQTTDVDSVSGATYTSNGIKEAVENALKQAK
jgi:fumarate reductase flavoprotein subunit